MQAHSYSFIAPKSPGGLGDAKASSLTINVRQAEEGWTRTVNKSNDQIPSLLTPISALPRTPGTGNTFGFPDHIHRSAQPPSPMTPSSPGEREQMVSQRLERYSQAETALRTSMARLAEPSPQELQIRVLRRATAVLTEHAEQARESSAKLQTLLRDEQLDPKEYQNLKQQRWFEDKRQADAEAQSKIVGDCLDKLSKGSSLTEPLEPFNVRQANLLTFLSSSYTKRPLKFRSSRRTSTSIPQFHFKTSYLSCKPASESTSPRSGMRNSVALTFGIQLDGVAESVSESVSSLPTPTNSSWAVAPAPVQFISDLESPTSSEDWDGRAIIFQSTSADIDRRLANMSQVRLPEYAVDLVDDFELGKYRMRANSNPLVDWEVVSPTEAISFAKVEAVSQEIEAPEVSPEEVSFATPPISPPASTITVKRKPSVLRKPRPESAQVLSETDRGTKRMSGMRVLFGSRAKAPVSEVNLAPQFEHTGVLRPKPSLRRKLSLGGLQMFTNFHTVSEESLTSNGEDVGTVAPEGGVTVAGKWKRKLLTTKV
ncbi:hypothetical protein C8J56DRAFT_931198 [Mycena floridula]|nr:hypothetical protein C8J56DRAFT_931198 [Mycena floridula]